MLNGQLPVPQSTRHVAFAVPIYRSDVVLLVVEVIVGWNVPNELRVLLVKFRPDTAETNLHRSTQVGIRPPSEALKDAVTQVVPVMPRNLWNPRAFQHAKDVLAWKDF